MDGSRSFFISPSSLLLLLFLLAAGLRGIYEGRSSRGQVQVHAGTRLRSWTNYRWRRGEVTGNVRTGERDRATFHSDTQYERTVSRVDGNSVFPRWRGGEGGKRRKKGTTIKLSSFRSTGDAQRSFEINSLGKFSGFSIKSILGRIGFLEYAFKNYFIINLIICFYKYSTLASPQIQFIHIYIIINNN